MKSCSIFILLLLYGLFAYSQNVYDESVTIILQPDPDAGKDAFIEDYPLNDYRNKNWGNSVEFSAMSWTQGPSFVTRSLIEFDLDMIPANASIISAVLYLYAYGDEGHGTGHEQLTGSNVCFLQRITTAWDEQTVTWNTQPQVSEMNQVLISASAEQMQDYSINVTDLLRDSHNFPEESHGFMLRLENETPYRRMFFATSDVMEISKRPKLEVVFSYSETEDPDVYETHNQEGPGYLDVPSGFSPNGDGLNDILYAIGMNVEDMEFTIYNRWGRVIFKSHSLTDGWDGTYQGKLLDPAVFVYVISGRSLANGEIIRKRGNITLMR